jgi:hypothetical protein
VLNKCLTDHKKFPHVSVYIFIYISGPDLYPAYNIKILSESLVASSYCDSAIEPELIIHVYVPLVKT